MRGQATFQSLFPDITNTCTEKTGKGRNPENDAKRNDLLLARYIYYGTYTHNRYDWVINQLHEEFFLAKRRIMDIISENVLSLREMRKNPPTLKELQKRWPHLVW